MATRQVKQRVIRRSSHHNPAKARPLGLGPIMFVDLAIWGENFYTRRFVGENTYVQCAKKTPKKNAQAQVQKAAAASKV
jgi:hypothetical protein